MDLFPEFSIVKDYGFYKWQAINKSHHKFTQDDIKNGLVGPNGIANGAIPPKVSKNIFDERYVRLMFL